MVHKPAFRGLEGDIYENVVMSGRTGARLTCRKRAGHRLLMLFA
jgi:hypothetical protein